MVRSGYRLPWKEGRKAPLSRYPIWFPQPKVQQAYEALDSEVRNLVKKGAVQVVHNHKSPGFYGRLFVVPKASGGWRPVLDLSTLTLYLEYKRFRMETVSSIRDAIRPEDWRFQSISRMLISTSSFTRRTANFSALLGRRKCFSLWRFRLVWLQPHGCSQR